MTSHHDPQPVRSWLANLSPGEQIGYGCLAVIFVGTLVMYCAGTLSLVARPMLLAHSTPTYIVPPTLQATPTQQAAPTFLNLPPGTLIATPTQAPIPTREPPTITPTVDLTNPPPTPTITPSPTFGRQGSPVRRSPTSTPSPTFGRQSSPVHRTLTSTPQP
ncbi:MAG: hypothetical protein M1482_04840 [Chloroflexi bacterium]|nr:hypothetical protein [Chloroflexota bacterium]